MRANQKAGIARRFADPEKRAAAIATATANIARWRETDEGRARLAEAGRNMRRFSQTPEALAKWRAGRAAAGAKRTAAVLAWCPPEYLETYRLLTRSKSFTAIEARAMIEAEIEAKSPAAQARRQIAEFDRRQRERAERERREAY